MAESAPKVARARRLDKTLQSEVGRLDEASGLRFHEIDCERVVYPRDGPVAGYFYSHPDPAALIYWFADEVGPAVRRALELRRR